MKEKPSRTSDRFVMSSSLDIKTPYYRDICVQIMISEANKLERKKLLVVIMIKARGCENVVV
jgi:hypothetical protein